MWRWQAVVVVPTCVAVALAVGSGGAHVCGGDRRWWWCPLLWQWQWQAVVVVPTCVAWQAVVVVPTYVAWQAVVVVPTCVAVALAVGGGGGHVCGSGRRCWWCPRVWQWTGGVVVVPTCVVVEVSGSDAHVWQWKAVWW